MKSVSWQDTSKPWSGFNFEELLSTYIDHWSWNYLEWTGWLFTHLLIRPRNDFFGSIFHLSTPLAVIVIISEKGQQCSIHDLSRSSIGTQPWVRKDGWIDHGRTLMEKTINKNEGGKYNFCCTPAIYIHAGRTWQVLAIHVYVFHTQALQWSAWGLLQLLKLNRTSMQLRIAWCSVELTLST